MLNQYKKAVDYAEIRIPVLGPAGIEVFTNEATKENRRILAQGWQDGYNERCQEELREKAQQLDQLISTLRFAELKFPWWKRWFTKKT